MKRLALALALALAASPAFAAMPPKTLTIRDDMGGPVAERVAQIEALRATGRTVEIRGTCASSCTMMLAVACVTPSARLRFHGPTSQYPGIALPRDEFERASRVMADHYPPAIRGWFMATARHETVGLKTITGAEAVRLGARMCK